MNKFGIRKKKITIGLLVAGLSVGMSGCSLPDSLFTDSGTDVIEEVDYTQYLDFTALEKDPQQENSSWNGYDIYVLDYGTFETSIAGIKASLEVIEISPVRVEQVTGTMRLTELLVARNTYLEKGDVIARVTVETDAIALEELERKLLRLEENLAEYKADYAERYAKALEECSVYLLPGKADRLKMEQMQRDYEWALAGYEKQVADCKKNIEEMKNMTATEELLAPEAGYVLEVSKLQVGQQLYSGDLLCNIAPTSKMMLQFSDESQHYGYGMDLVLLVGDRRTQKSYQVKAASALGKSLSGSWDRSTTQIIGDYDIAELMSKGPYTVTGTTNVMENVLLLPVQSVTVDGDKYYVTVVNSDNTLEKKQFIPGGKNTQYYWVFDGLQPGMKIILEN